MSTKKALLIARYLIEPHTGADAVVNEEMERDQKGIVDDLYELIGPYKVYGEPVVDEEGADAVDYADEAEMRARVAERFGRSKHSLLESLGCEDYEGEGVVDLVQLKEAVLAADEEVDAHLLDFMLWYVYVRSDSTDKMEYKVLMQLIEEE